jgi:hypothetical protein
MYEIVLFSERVDNHTFFFGKISRKLKLHFIGGDELEKLLRNSTTKVCRTRTTRDFISQTITTECRNEKYAWRFSYPFFKRTESSSYNNKTVKSWQSEGTQKKMVETHTILDQSWSVVSCRSGSGATEVGVSQRAGIKGDRW